MFFVGELDDDDDDDEGEVEEDTEDDDEDQEEGMRFSLNDGGEEDEVEEEEEEEEKEKEEEPPSKKRQKLDASSSGRKPEQPVKQPGKGSGSAPTGRGQPDGGGGDTGFYAQTPAGTTFVATSFTDLNLSRPLVKACAALGYTTPTPIQAGPHWTIVGWFDVGSPLNLAGGLWTGKVLDSDMDALLQPTEALIPSCPYSWLSALFSSPSCHILTLTVSISLSHPRILPLTAPHSFCRDSIFTPQAACIPLALSGRDICGSAMTGSGKTAAFTLPILERLLHRPR